MSTSIIRYTNPGFPAATGPDDAQDQIAGTYIPETLAERTDFLRGWTKYTERNTILFAQSAYIPNAMQAGEHHKVIELVPDTTPGGVDCTISAPGSATDGDTVTIRILPTFKRYKLAITTGNFYPLNGVAGLHLGTGEATFRYSSVANLWIPCSASQQLGARLTEPVESTTYISAPVATGTNTIENIGITSGVREGSVILVDAQIVHTRTPIAAGTNDTPAAYTVTINRSGGGGFVGGNVYTFSLPTEEGVRTTPLTQYPVNFRVWSQPITGVVAGETFSVLVQLYGGTQAAVAAVRSYSAQIRVEHRPGY